LLKSQKHQEYLAFLKKLSFAQELSDVMKVVREAARSLTDADGATFVLQENGKCFYAEENAISPLWKGKRFPLETCISGWVMLNKTPALIYDIYQDSRIPHDAYRPTFVKSLLMVPVRREAPIAAIGNYWATHHHATQDEVDLLCNLADATSLALRNVELFSELGRVKSEIESKIAEQTALLRKVNEELESFSYSVSHDLQAPVRRVSNFTQLLREKVGSDADPEVKICLDEIENNVSSMGQLIHSLLTFARYDRREITKTLVDVQSLVRKALDEVLQNSSGRKIEVRVGELPRALADQSMLYQVFLNLLSNAIKYTKGRDVAKIEIFGHAEGSAVIYQLKDNGVGFDMGHAGKLFKAFQRLHGDDQFEGHGIGLAFVKRILDRQGGEIWAIAEKDKGASFFVKLPVQS
jgi:signal transduction histidine kinase